MDVLYLDQNWDLALDSSRNIALASNPYALAVAAACAIKTFLGEVYYNTTLGVPYFPSILGKAPPWELMRAQFVEKALTVPEVVAARVFFTGFKDRQVSGQVQVTDQQGNTSFAGF